MRLCEYIFTTLPFDVRLSDVSVVSTNTRCASMRLEMCTFTVVRLMKPTAVGFISLTTVYVSLFCNHLSVELSRWTISETENEIWFSTISPQRQSSVASFIKETISSLPKPPLNFISVNEFKASFVNYSYHIGIVRDKMTAILQKIFQNESTRMKCFVFWFEFHWNLFLRVHLTALFQVIR